ncbi:MAG: RNA polymerase sigma factor [Solirubrobacteraceae bacterium]
MTAREHPDFAHVYEQHVWRVYGFLAYRVRNRDLAEDLTQATFERALRAWSRFDPRRASAAPWLLTIARNVLIDDVRRDRSTPVADLDDRLLPAVDGPEARFAGSPALIQALANLPARDREVLALRFGGDLTGADIATVLGLTLANVQQIISRSLRKLRQELETSDSPGVSVEHR